MAMIRINKELPFLACLILSLLTVKPVYASAPIAYGQWSASLAADGKTSVISDTATNPCQTGGASCTVIAEGDGFLYRHVVIGNEEYSQMIMLDSAATGDASTLGFSHEVYTPMQLRTQSNVNINAQNGGPWVFANDNTTYARAAQGIASRTIIQDANLFMDAEIQRGFARDIIGQNNASGFSIADPLSSATGLAVAQSNRPGITVPATGNDAAQQGWSTKLIMSLVDTGFSSGFSSVRWTDTPQSQATAGALNTNKVRGQMTDIWQNVTDTITGQTQKFDQRRREGRGGYQWFCSTAANCNNYALTAGGTSTLNGGASSTTWNAGGRVVATWLATNLGSAMTNTNVAAADIAYTCTGFFSPFLNQCFPAGFGTGGPAWSVSYTAKPVVSQTTFNAQAPGSASWAPDVNWPVALANIPDPFAGTSPRRSAPTFP
ncbi:MAG: hypothetical protein D6698_08090 [Gammaproteobacteria bacterium]|nr:MAG: hypothetical protein D6698_08090 [Gammaproteobacteria bacterium]